MKWFELTLSLQILLQTFKIDIAETAKGKNAEELAAVVAQLYILAKSFEDWLGTKPYNDDWDVEQSKNEKTSLKNDSEVVFVFTSGEACGGQRVNRSRAAEGDEPSRRPVCRFSRVKYKKSQQEIRTSQTYMRMQRSLTLQDSSVRPRVPRWFGASFAACRQGRLGQIL